MFWLRHLTPRMIVLGLLGLASLAGTGDLALPDEHFMFAADAAAEPAPLPHSALPHDSGPVPDGHPVHTCHCVHAHGLALLASSGGVFTLDAPVTVAPVLLAGTPARGTAPPPFHPPKTLS